MKILFLLVNSLCDMNCTYCFYTTGHGKRSGFRILPEMANHTAEKIASAGFSTVILSGGDPLHSKLKNETYILIRELKIKKLKVIINTSAAYLNENDLDTIINLEVDRIDISIDSHDETVHNTQRGKYTDAVSAIIGLVKKGYRNVTTTTVVTNLNAPSLLETIFWLQRLGVKDVRIQRMFHPDNPCDTEDIMRSMYEVGKYLRAPHTPKYIELTECAFSRKPVPCHAQCRMGKEYFVCNAQGTLTPCFHRNDIVLGNLFDDSVETLIEAFKHHELIIHDVPPCFGSHCASLFDIPNFWRNLP